MLKQYKLVNNITGWVVFLIAAVSYCLTVEPSASFWDCPEFISTAYKLEVGHPPGAPFFMLTGNFFSLFAKDPTQVAFMVNIMSALLSALCILFLFWTITHLARKLYCDEDGWPKTWAQTLVVMAAGATGALAYAWSDTFWFSAEEGEVYAYSSMFTALVFWLILKWEEHADEPHSDRYLVLIFYLTGISVGVHLLNLLCLPAIALVWYYKKQPQAKLKGSLMALCVGFLLIAAVLYGLVPGIGKVGGWFELFFVNWLGMPFNTGMIVYIILLVAIVIAAIWSTTTTNRARTNVLYLLSVALLGIPFFGKGTMSILIGFVLLGILGYLLYSKGKDGEFLLRKRVLNTSLLCMLMLMIGYSSYALIIIRSEANPPMDQNSPEDIFSLTDYLGREQYGSTPLFYGQSFTSQAIDTEKTTKWHRKEKTAEGEPDTYEPVEEVANLVYPASMKMLFPRMHSAAHAQAYEDWLGGDLPMRDVDVEYEGQYIPMEMPTQGANIRFFLSYQVNFMYWRYFMWNFAGRQNGYQSNGELEHGNWISGIPFIDNMLYGDQSRLPDELQQDKGRNVFFFLPLLLGLLGLFWQVFKGDKGVKQFWIVFFLFFMTGLAIVLYLNQTPQQPRERDYAYAGSFYAFAIWIGLGVTAIASWLRGNVELNTKLQSGSTLKKAIVGEPIAAVIASVIGILVPLQMVSQTWDDHDRSGRYACRDFGLNYLNTMPEKLADGTPAYPIIFSNGDNDTFPLWYNQETEGQRTDSRVCNLEYLNTEWYTDQMVRPAYDSPALPIAWKRAEYVDDGRHGYFKFRDECAQLDELKRQNPAVDPYDLKYIMDNYVRTKGYFPTDSVVLNVNKQNVINQGMFLPNGPDSIPDKISISLKWASDRGGMYRNMVMVYEMLARNDWKRPIYMSVTLGHDNYAGLHDYLVLEGLAYRLTPFKVGQGTVDTDKMFDNLCRRFRYGGVSAPGIFLDETNMRMCQTHRRMFTLLAETLLQEGKTQKALAALRKSLEVLPPTTVPYEQADYDIADLWLKCGDKKQAANVATAVARQNWQYLDWANTLSTNTLMNYQKSCLRALYGLVQAVQVLQEAGSPDAKTYEQKLNQISQTEAGAYAAEALQRQMSSEE